MIIWGLWGHKLYTKFISAYYQQKIVFFRLFYFLVLFDAKNVPQLAITRVSHFPLVLSFILTNSIDLCNKKLDQPGFLDPQRPWEMPVSI